MLFVYNKNAIPAQIAVLSISQQLPENLLIDAVNEHGKFSLEFLFRLTPEQLFKLKTECEKKKNKNVFLSFSREEKPAPKLVEREIRDLSAFDWSKVADIRISGDTSPYQYSRDSEAFHYISIVFVMKD